MQKIKKQNLSMAGEYAVASEICRRDLYAQVTLGRFKRTDILVHDPRTEKEVLVEVKAKQGKEWPGIKGIVSEKRLLVFVDFQNKKPDERPDFYVLNAKDWQDFLKSYVVNRSTFGKLIDGYIPVGKDGYKGAGVLPEQITQHSEKWEKLELMLAS